MAILGRDTEGENVIELSSSDRKQGTYIIGVNGTGKTVLLLNIALSDIDYPNSGPSNSLLKLVAFYNKFGFLDFSN